MIERDNFRIFEEIRRDKLRPLEEIKAEIQAKILAFKNLWEQVGKFGGGVVKQDIGEREFELALDLMTRTTDQTLPLEELPNESIYCVCFLGDVEVDFVPGLKSMTLWPRTEFVDGGIGKMVLAQERESRRFFFELPPRKGDIGSVAVRVETDVDGKTRKVLYKCERKVEADMSDGYNSKRVMISDGKFEVGVKAVEPLL